MKGKDEKIIYAIPKYLEGQGDIALVVNERGEELTLPFHIRTFIKKLAYKNYVDLVSIRRRLQEEFSQKNILPYPLNPELILIPIKVRRPRLKKDGAFGYINYLWVKEIEKQDRFCQVIFKNHSTLKVLQSYNSVKAKMLQGAWLRDCFIPQNMYSSNPSTKYLCREDIGQIIGQLMEVYREL